MKAGLCHVTVSVWQVFKFDISALCVDLDEALTEVAVFGWKYFM